MSAGGYEGAPATKLVATRCAVCGRPLVDAVSVETGIGPDCRKNHGYSRPDVLVEPAAVFAATARACGSSEAGTKLYFALVEIGGACPAVDGDLARTVANRAVYRVAADATTDDDRRACLRVVYALGFWKLAKACAPGGGVEVSRDGGDLVVRSPYNPRFVDHLRALRGRFSRETKTWRVPASARAGLWAAIRDTYPAGTMVFGDRGAVTLGDEPASREAA